MIDTLQKIIEYFDIYPLAQLPIDIPNTNRISLAELFGHLRFGIGAEIGVEQGLYSKVLCENNPKVVLHCIDPWEAYQGYREHVSQEKLDVFLENTKQRLAPYDVNIIRKYSTDAAKDFPDDSLDFVYIDGNHELSHVVADICAWYPKVRVGGIVAGHDFISRGNPKMNMHVPEGVRAFTSAYKINPWFLLGSKDKKPGELRDNSRSWFFVKE